MRPGRYDTLNFDAGKQNLTYMLKEAERDLWGFMREQSRINYKRLLEELLRFEQEEYLELESYERNPDRKGFRSGSTSITIKTSLGEIEIKRPRLRKQNYESKVLPKYTKNERQILELIANLYLVGVSTRKMKKGLEGILGKEGISSTQVSTITNRVKPEMNKFHRRDLEDKYVYLYLDGIVITIKGISGNGRKQVVLAAYGVDREGKKELIDFMVVKSESKENWEGFLFNLYERGLKGKELKLIIIDGCGGLSSALDRIYARVLRQRCWVHKLRNAAKYIRKKDQEKCLGEVKGVYKAENVTQARKRFKKWKYRWGKICPNAVNCIEKDLDELLNFFVFDKSHRIKIRTTNPIERVFKEFRRRTNVMGNHMPNMDGCEKIIYIMAVFMNERWQEKRYLRFKNMELMSKDVPLRRAA